MSLAIIFFPRRGVTVCKDRRHAADLAIDRENIAPVTAEKEVWKGEGVLGLWFLVASPWFLVSGPWSLVLGPWSLAFGPWALVSGPLSLVSGPWSLASGP